LAGGRVVVLADEEQGPRAVARALRTGPVVAGAATVAQRAVVVVPVARGREHQAITKKPGTAVIDSTI